MDNFEKITKSPEALGEFLSGLPVLSAPWDKAFNDRVCSSCSAENCDNCARPERNNPLWWLGLEAEATK